MKLTNMKRRVASTALAGALALSMAAPAFASSNPTTKITGNYNNITLAVTVPSTGKAIINPYGLPYKVGETSISGQQITTAAPLMIQNKSVVGLKVEATVTGTEGDGVTLEAYSSNPDYSAEANKKLAVQFQAFEAPEVTADNVAETETINALFAALKDEDADLTADVITIDDGDPATAATGDLVLREGSEDGTLQSGGAAFFRLAGKAAQNAPWAKEDTFGAEIVFKFTPKEYVKEAGTFTIDKKSLSLSASGDKATITLTPNLPDGVTVADGDVQWISSKPTCATVENKTTTTSGTQTIKAEVTPVAATGSNGKVKITVTFVGSDGITYTSSLASADQIAVVA